MCRGPAEAPDICEIRNNCDPEQPQQSCWLCLAHSPVCRAWCSLPCTQTKMELSFLLLPPSWGLGWGSPSSRKVCIKVKLLLATGRAASVSRKVWPSPGP